MRKCHIELKNTCCGAPFCKSEFKVWILPGDCFVACPSWGCQKSFVIEELLRPEYQAKNGKVDD